MEKGGLTRNLPLLLGVKRYAVVSSILLYTVCIRYSRFEGTLPLHTLCLLVNVHRERKSPVSLNTSFTEKENHIKVIRDIFLLPSAIFSFLFCGSLTSTSTTMFYDANANVREADRELHHRTQPTRPPLHLDDIRWQNFASYSSWSYKIFFVTFFIHPRAVVSWIQVCWKLLLLVQFLRTFVTKFSPNLIFLVTIFFSIRQKLFSYFFRHEQFFYIPNY